jgi:hypothetical protein
LISKAVAIEEARKYFLAVRRASKRRERSLEKGRVSARQGWGGWDERFFNILLHVDDHCGFPEWAVLP